MSDISDLIQKAGGVTKVARVMGVPVQTVAAWKARKSIPAERVTAFEAATGIPRQEVRPDLWPQEGAR